MEVMPKLFGNNSRRYVLFLPVITKLLAAADTKPPAKAAREIALVHFGERLEGVFDGQHFEKIKDARA